MSLSVHSWFSLLINFTLFSQSSPSLLFFPHLTTEIKEDLLFLPQNNIIMSERKYFDDSTVALGTIYTVFLLGVIVAIVFFG